MEKMNKSSFRQNVRAKRLSFGEEFIEKAATDACEILKSMDEFKNSSAVLLYYPINNEISPLPIFSLAKSMNKAVAFPACDRERGTLVFRRIEDISELIPASYGLFEPDESREEIETDVRTLCIVPGIAFSRDGKRIGYGRGYYDRFLKDFKGKSVGFCYSELLFDSIPTEEHDLPVSFIVTQDEIIYIH